MRAWRLPLPRTLFARLMLIWLVGLVGVLALSAALVIGERDRASHAALFEGLAREIGAAVDVLDRLAPAERETWIAELGRRRLRLALRELPAEAEVIARHPLARALQDTLPERRIRVALIEHGAGNPDGPGPRGMRLHELHHRLLAAEIPLADGQTLLVRMPAGLIPPAPPPSPERLFAASLALLGGVALLSWLAVRLTTRPLSRLAAAADALGENPEREPLTTDGPVEVARAAQAFNRMQQRIREHVAERTRFLAAISHDLQTPITRLRLRAELVDDPALRDKIQADLDAMQSLVREGLAYARSLNDATPNAPVDLNALLAAIAADAEDMGWAVRISGQASRPCLARPDALRRALWNLVENGIKFGGEVDITLGEDTTHYTLEIADHGPGLPPEEFDKVFEPFYRTEASRSRETGGTGLGLAIARNLLRAQQGEVSLKNGERGGLVATVRLRRQPG